jgi:hypothetical protein
MTATTDHELRSRQFDIIRQRLITGDLVIVCLWSVLGLTLAALAFQLGFGAQMTDFLAISG